MENKNIQVVRTVADLRSAVAAFRAKGKTVALVPTMGNLHDGHLSLVREARRHADVVCATIFVNPTQFGPTEDFDSYPRTFDADRAMLESESVEIVYTPTVSEMYPDGFATAVSVTGITDCLCGQARPTHFQGVATVVTKLLLQALPDVAVFGEKDFQQLQVIRRLVTDLDIPVEIVGSATWREADGLAMSSRNRYLSDRERAIAPMLHQCLTQLATKITPGTDISPLIEETMDALVNAGFAKVDYLELRQERGLGLLSQYQREEARLFVAAHLGKARLIDNVKIR